MRRCGVVTFFEQMTSDIRELFLSQLHFIANLHKKSIFQSNLKLIARSTSLDNLVHHPGIATLMIDSKIKFVRKELERFPHMGSRMT